MQFTVILEFSASYYQGDRANLLAVFLSLLSGLCFKGNTGYPYNDLLRDLGGLRKISLPSKNVQILGSATAIFYHFLQFFQSLLVFG